MEIKEKADDITVTREHHGCSRGEGEIFKAPAALRG